MQFDRETAGVFRRLGGGDWHKGPIGEIVRSSFVCLVHRTNNKARPFNRACCRAFCCSCLARRLASFRIYHKSIYSGTARSTYLEIRTADNENCATMKIQPWRASCIQTKSTLAAKAA